MNEEYEYERVEIKPGDSSWVGKTIYDPRYIPTANHLTISAVGENNFLARGRYDEEETYSLAGDYFIRKPKRKTLDRVREAIHEFTLKRGNRPRVIQVREGVKKQLCKEIEELDLARFPFKQDNWEIQRPGTFTVLKIEGMEVVTPEEVLTWPYGEIIEVEEGE